MKLVVILSIFIFSLAAKAANFEFYPVNYESRFARSEDQDLSGTNPRNFALGFSYAPWAILLEVLNQTRFSGQEYSNFTGAHQEMLVWGRYEKFLVKDWAALAAAGIGYSQDEVEIRFGNDRSRAQGERMLLAGASVGTAVDLFKLIRLSVEGRLFFGGALDPSPQPDLILRSGFRF